MIMGIIAFVTRILCRKNRHNNIPNPTASNNLNNTTVEPILIANNEHVNSEKNEETTSSRHQLTVEADALIHHLPLLCENMESIEIITRLLSKKFITNMEAEVIKAEKTAYDRNFSLIALVKKKGPVAVRYFIESLKETNQEHLAQTVRHAGVATNLHVQASKKERTNFGTAQKALKTMYLERFQKVNPFSLPFTFDIENTWVSLALREDTKSSKATEDHAELLHRSFLKAKMLIIEGKPATGKTSLMRRIAYEWAQGKQELSKYDIIIYAEFHEVCEQEFKTVAELVITYLKAYFEEEIYQVLASSISDKIFCKNRDVLVLLDGYDESSLELDKQCEELHTYMTKTTITKVLPFHIALTTRPGYVSQYRGQIGRFVFADVLGFATEEQKQKYILNHFSTKEETDSLANIKAVHSLLKSNTDLATLAETPLFLTFICLVYEKIVDSTLLELYFNIIWWLLDRHQKDFPDRNVPHLFGFQHNSKSDKFQVIQDNYLDFPQLHYLGEMALSMRKTVVFNTSDLTKFRLDPIVEHVGLLLKAEKREKFFQRAHEFCFPHRTFQEFLAAYFLFHYGNESTLIDRDFFEIFNKDFFLEEILTEEFEKFLWRIMISNEMKIIPIRRLDIYEKYTTLVLDLTLFSSQTNIDVYLLNSCLKYCHNIKKLNLHCLSNHHPLCKSIDLSKMTQLEELSFSNLRRRENSQSLIIESNFSPTIETETIVLLPKCKEINMEFHENDFESAALFCKTMEYLLSALARGSAIKFQDVTVRNGSNEENNATSFTIDTIELKSLSMFSAMKAIPEVFTDQELNNALRYVSCADSLQIEESNPKKAFFGSFEGFAELKELRLKRMIFPANTSLTFNKRFNLVSLKFERCIIDLTSWQLISEEISSKRIKLLGFTLDSFIGEHFAEYFNYLRNCDGLHFLWIVYRYVDEFVWKSYEEEFVSIFCSLMQEMRSLKQVNFQYVELSQKNEATLRNACYGKKIKLEFWNGET